VGAGSPLVAIRWLVGGGSVGAGSPLVKLFAGTGAVVEMPVAGTAGEGAERGAAKADVNGIKRAAAAMAMEWEKAFDMNVFS
jgi:hypothetical protein